MACTKHLDNRVPQLVMPIAPNQNCGHNEERYQKERFHLTNVAFGSAAVAHDSSTWTAGIGHKQSVKTALRMVWIDLPQGAWQFERPFGSLFCMHKAFLILLMAVSVSACSSQQLSWFAGELWEEMNPPRSSYDAKYDEEAIFPVPNQRLACEMDWTCEKPLSEAEFDRLSDQEKFRVMHGDDLKPTD